MRLEQLEHLIRACADIAGDDDIVVVGSQAVLGSHADPPSTMLVSVEADVYPRHWPERLPLLPVSRFHSESIARELEARREPPS